MRKVVLIVVGLALLGFGGYRQLFGSDVSSADQMRCEQLVRSQNGDSAEAIDLLLPKCSDAGMVAMMDAQASGDDAQAAALRISAANQVDTSAHMLDWALIGGGLAALAGGVVAGRRKT